MADALNLALVEAGLVEDLKDVLDGRLVIRQRYLELLLLSVILGMADESAIDADALAVTLCEDLPGLGIQQLVLERRAACVDDENPHVSPFGSC